MNIKLKLFASLMEYLPPGGDRHEVEYQINPEMTTHDLAQKLKIPEKLAHLVVVNGTVLDPNEIKSRKISEGDTIAIFPPVAGG